VTTFILLQLFWPTVYIQDANNIPLMNIYYLKFFALSAHKLAPFQLIMPSRGHSLQGIYNYICQIL